MTRAALPLTLAALCACGPSTIPLRAADAGTTPAADAGATPAADAGATPAAAAPAEARTTAIPACSVFVDAAATGTPDGTAARPYPTMTAALAAAASGDVLCVAEGTYREALEPGEKSVTLAGGFRSGSNYLERDSARYVTRAQGSGADVFFRSTDPGPTEGQRTVIDGLEITGYSQAIVRDIYYPQAFDITHCYIHDNTCAAPDLIGAAFLLVNVSGTIEGNVIAKNRCGRGGGGALGDGTNTSRVVLRGNRVIDNEGTEPGISHGGGWYLLVHELEITGNTFERNAVTGWGGGLYVGAFVGGGQTTTARLAWNVYRGNRADAAGGGLFCDDAARCVSDHELYDGNCGGNILLDSGPDPDAPTVASFDHLTNHGALSSGCGDPGAGIIVNKENAAPDRYTVTNAIFWGNAPGHDLDAYCDVGCDAVSVELRYTSIDTTYGDGGVPVVFGEGVIDGVDPAFVDAAAGDFHLRSTRGHWTPEGYAVDADDSPLLGRADPARAPGDAPARAGAPGELGTYGHSAEASLTR